MHGNSRFSEDIDLDNFGLSWQAFGELIQKVKLFLELEGFLVETSMVARDAFHSEDGHCLSRRSTQGHPFTDRGF
jgi:hypothetical protein